MAENVVGVVSIIEMRNELQIDDDDNSYDARIERVITQSVAWVSKRLSISLIDTTLSHYLDIPMLKDNPIKHKLNDIKSIESFKYWETTQKLREVPTGNIVANTLGRITYKEIWPPETNWPDTLFDSTFFVQIKHGLEEIEPDHKAAVILGARQLFTGYPEIQPTASFNILLAPSFMDRVRF